MKNFKRLLFISLMLTLALTTVACGSQKPNPGDSENNQTVIAEKMENELLNVVLDIPNISQIKLANVTISDIVSSGFDSSVYQIIITEKSKTSNYIVNYQLKHIASQALSSSKEKVFSGFSSAELTPKEKIDYAVKNTTLTYQNEQSTTVYGALLKNITASSFDISNYKIMLSNFAVAKDSVKVDYKLVSLDDSLSSLSLTKTFDRFIPLSKSGTFKNLKIDSFPLVAELLNLDNAVSPSQNETKIKNIQENNIDLNVSINFYEDKTGIMKLSISGNLLGYNLENQIITIENFFQHATYSSLASMDLNFDKLIEDKITIESLKTMSSSTMLGYFKPISIYSSTIEQTLNTQNDTTKYSFALDFVKSVSYNSTVEIGLSIIAKDTYIFENNSKSPQTVELYARRVSSFTFYNTRNTLNYLKKYVTNVQYDVSNEYASKYDAEFTADPNYNIATAFVTLGDFAKNYFGGEDVIVSTIASGANDISGKLFISYVLKHGETESEPTTFFVEGFKTVTKEMLENSFSALQGTNYTDVATGNSNKSRTFKAFIEKYNALQAITPTDGYVVINDVSDRDKVNVFDPLFRLLNDGENQELGNTDALFKKCVIQFENENFNTVYDDFKHTINKKIAFKSIIIQRGEISIQKVGDTYTAKVDLKFSVVVGASIDMDNTDTTIEFTISCFIPRISYIA